MSFAQNRTDGGFVSIVSTYSNNGDVSGNHGLSEFDSDIWYVKLSSTGELLSQQCFGGAGSEGLYFGAVKKSNNNFVIAAVSDYGPSFDVGCAPHGDLGIDDDWWVFEIKDCEFYAPIVPQPPIGPDTLCHTTDSISVYQIAGDSTAWGYHWLLEPAEAGTITADSLQSLVHWNTSYQGPAHISAAAWNDCGESAWSTVKTTMVYSCVGLPEQKETELVVAVYPNPAKDYIIFKTQANKSTASTPMEIFDIYGRKVASLPMVSGKAVLDVKSFSNGIYFYQLSHEGRHQAGKFVVR